MTPRFPKQPEGEERLFAQLSFPEIYEKALVGPLFQPWAQLMLEDIDLAAGDRVLDVACGTGIVARLAKEQLGRTGTVVGIDLSPPMLAVARQLAPAIDWREGDAGALPLRDDEQFDVVLCQQGLQFFPDRAAAVRQMRRALASGGRLSVSTWRHDEEMPLLVQLRRVAERHVGPIVDRRHSFGEASALEAMLREAGLREVQSKILSRVVRFDDASIFVRLNAMALLSMSPASNVMDDDEERERVLAAVMNDSTEVVLPHTSGAALAFELRSNVMMARG